MISMATCFVNRREYHNIDIISFQYVPYYTQPKFANLKVRTVLRTYLTLPRRKGMEEADGVWSVRPNIIRG